MHMCICDEWILVMPWKTEARKNVHLVTSRFKNSGGRCTRPRGAGAGARVAEQQEKGSTNTGPYYGKGSALV